MPCGALIDRRRGGDCVQVELQEACGGRDALVQSHEEQVRELQDQVSTLREELEQEREQVRPHPPQTTPLSQHTGSGAL